MDSPKPGAKTPFAWSRVPLPIPKAGAEWRVELTCAPLPPPILYEAGPTCAGVLVGAVRPVRWMPEPPNENFGAALRSCPWATLS